MVEQKVVVLLLGLVFIVVVLGALMISRDVSIKAGDTQLCAQSVREHALGKKISPSTPTDLLCTTREVVVKSGESEMQKKTIADEMASCWGVFGEGQLKLFDIESGDYCAVCSRMEFNKPTTLYDFSRYLMTNKRPNGETYYSYLFASNDVLAVSSKFAESGLQGRDTLSTEKPLAVVYVASKDVSLWTSSAAKVAGAGCVLATASLTVLTGGLGWPSLLFCGASGAVSGYAAGPYFAEEDYQAQIVLWPYDEISKLPCAKLEGRDAAMGFVD